jgi:hypothetical protein
MESVTSESNILMGADLNSSPLWAQGNTGQSAKIVSLRDWSSRRLAWENPFDQFSIFQHRNAIHYH